MHIHLPDPVTVRGQGANEWAQASNRVDEWYRETCARLIKQGVKAAHPNDGWVDRKKGEIGLSYPFFEKRDIKVGDLIAVLDYKEEPKLLTVTEICTEKTQFCKFSFFKFQENFPPISPVVYHNIESFNFLVLLILVIILHFVCGVGQ